MSRNTKEVALIQIRSGKLSEMPKALHQSEFGLAKDANRVFLGNASNTILGNRTYFPYQNLELLTEYSELKDYFKYSYENNIINVLDSESRPVDRIKLKEFLPIVVSCLESVDGTISEGGTLIINNVEITIPNDIDVYGIVQEINKVSDKTNTYATIFPGKKLITFICTANDLVISDNNSGILNKIHFPTNPQWDISMPERFVTEKLDDFLNITDFGVKGDGIQNCSKRVYEALVEIYKNYDNTQFFRNVFFPAGTYNFDINNEDQNAKYFSPFPLLSNLHIRGEGIDRTIIKNLTSNTLLSCIDKNLNAEYSSANNYGKVYVTDDYPNGNTSNLFPTNILIEDVTFDSNSETIARLIGCSNVTFNRVKFIGSFTSNAVTISGKEVSYLAGGVENVLTATSNNITFNDCIFLSSNNTVNIEEFAENITFNNCKIVGFKTPSFQIGNDDVSNGINVKAINIDGCMFEQLYDDSGLNDGNSSSSLALNSSVIELGINSEYISTTKCTFDKNIIERTETHGITPYKDKGVGEEYNSSNTYGVGQRCIYKHNYYIANTVVDVPEEFDPIKWTPYQRHNYTDILNINTDEKKLLRFKFTQPLWEYINYLTNLNGEVPFIVDGEDAEITAENGLNITEDSNGINIKSVKSGDVSISLDNEATLKLGKLNDESKYWIPSTLEEPKTYYVDDEVIVDGIIYKCIYEHISSDTSFENDLYDKTNDRYNWEVKSISQIVIDRVLQLNDHMISNRDGSKDIIIEPAAGKVVEIIQTPNSATTYEDKIVNKDDAVPNVAFVKRYSMTSLTKHLTQEDIDTVDENGDIEIGSFPVDSFGNNVHITGVTVNVRNPFYKVLPYMDHNSSEYTNERMYYQGDVVYRSSDYAVMLVNHWVNDEEEPTIVTNKYMQKIPLNTYTKEIKYVDVIGNGDGVSTSLTNTIEYDYTAYDVFNINYVDLQRNNLFGYTSGKPYVAPYSNTTASDTLVAFQDRNYLVMPDMTITTACDLHDTDKADRMYDEGFIYKFDEDSNFNLGSPSTPNPYTINYSNGNIVVRLYTDDGTLLTSANKDTILFNPAGDVIIKIDFIKNELIPPEESEG